MLGKIDLPDARPFSEVSRPPTRIRNLHVLALAVVCLAAVAPFFWNGSPSGHDFEFHMFSWMDVLSQWKQGVIYPRWASLAHWGYGEARFLFYPPASWTLGAALGAFLPWKVVPGVYCWLVLLLSGLSMYRLARAWAPDGDALFAAALYAINPYHLLVVYWRSAFAELLAAALLPLMFLAVLRLRQSGFRPVLRLGLVLAAAWLINAPAAVMIHYSVAGLAVVNAILDRSWSSIGRTSLAVLLGAGLASFYLIPTVYETRWVNISEVLAPGLRPQDNFLFAVIADAEHNQFNRLVSWVAVIEIGVLLLAMWISRSERLRKRHLWILLASWGGGAALLMMSITDSLWQVLPKLRFVQLPWRWLLCLNVALVLLLMMALQKWRWRVLVSGALLASVWIAGHRIQPPWWDQPADIKEMSDAIQDGIGYEGSDEYVPAGADAYELDKNAPHLASSTGKTLEAKVFQWGAVEKHVYVKLAKSGLLTMRLLNYPAWKAVVNGKDIPIETTDVTGQVALQLEAGASDIRIYFARTRDRTAGILVSLLSALIFGTAWIRTPLSNSEKIKT